MRFSSLAIFAVAAATSAIAQSASVIDWTKLPACAKQCTVFASAESGCVPPAAQVTSQQTYQSCFCQSALITGLHSSGAQCQATGCSADDAAKITTYYNALCAGPVVAPPTSPTTSSTSSSTSSTSTATAEAAGNNKTSTNKSNPSWFSSHWKWVLFLILFVLAFLFFSIGGIWLKRRFARKRDAEKANMAAHDAPYVPPPPGAERSERSLSGILKGSSSRINASSTRVNGVPPTPPMTAMSGGTGNMNMDGGVGGIAPPRGNRLRSRSSTLQSMGLSNGSNARLPEPVAWGPHQHQAHYAANNPQASSDSVPPSPVSAITPPHHPVFRNRDAVNSEPRFVHYRATQTSISAESLNNYSTPAIATSEIERPRTAGSATQGNRAQPSSFPVRP